jgi:dipeptidyl aminopeptidase/acylaminoacyl peptidase
VRSSDTVSSVHVINVDGTGARQLTAGTALNGFPRWSPNGDTIMFLSTDSGNADIYLVNADGSNRRVLVSNPASDAYPSWSPDGSKVVFDSDRDGNDEIYTINMDGSGLRRLTINDDIDLFAVWSPRVRGLIVSEVALELVNEEPDAAMSVAQVVTKVRGSIVQVKVDEGSGSGFVIDAAGLVLTNNHVVSGSTQIKVVFEDGQEFTATLVGRDMVRDLALIKIDPGTRTLVPLVFADRDRVDLGEQMMVLGYPLGARDLSVTQGLISSLRDDDSRNTRFIQTDAAVNPGNSGGPMVNLYGEVVGVVSSKFVGLGIEGVGFAISDTVVYLVLDRLKNGETIGQML